MRYKNVFSAVVAEKQYYAVVTRNRSEAFPKSKTPGMQLYRFVSCQTLQ